MNSGEQQRLFKHYNPLEDRLGSDFFDELPKKPGIYKMFGRKGVLLYVGKAKNIRDRLFTYRRAKVGKTSRKTVRLIRMVHRIEYELCEDEKQALLRENELIRNHRPEFNHAKKSPETYYFVHIKRKEDALFFKLNMQQYTGEDGEWTTFGAFKGHSLVRRALGELLRMLYITEYKVSSVHELPSILLKNLTPLNYQMAFRGEPIFSRIEILSPLFKGTSEQFFVDFIDHVGTHGMLDEYIGKLILEDMEALKRFFEQCCKRNYEIRERFDLPSHIIPQHKLDDFLIELVFE